MQYHARAAAAARAKAPLRTPSPAARGRARASKVFSCSALDLITAVTWPAFRLRRAKCKTQVEGGDFHTDVSVHVHRTTDGTARTNQTPCAVAAYASSPLTNHPPPYFFLAGRGRCTPSARSSLLRICGLGMHLPCSYLRVPRGCVGGGVQRERVRNEAPRQAVAARSGGAPRSGWPPHALLDDAGLLHDGGGQLLLGHLLG